MKPSEKKKFILDNYDKMNSEQLARALGVSQSRVCQICIELNVKPVAIQKVWLKEWQKRTPEEQKYHRDLTREIVEALRSL